MTNKEMSQKLASLATRSDVPQDVSLQLIFISDELGNNLLGFDSALEAWLGRAQDIINKNHKDMNFTMIEPDKLTIDPKGQKYIRIVRNDGSVHCFIEKSTGNVLRAASWRAPAKHPRGNIFEIGKEGVSPYGANYLR